MGKNDRRKPDAPGPQGTMAKFMEPCLLLLLKQESSHGYELMEKLSPFGFEGPPATWRPFTEPFASWKMPG